MARSARASSQSVDSAGVGRDNRRSLLEGYPSGQRGQTVNLLAYAFGGSNPPPSTSLIVQRIAGAILNATRKRRGPGGAKGGVPGTAAPPPAFALGGSSSMVEHQFSKLITRVRFPPSAPKLFHAHVAQSVEHFLGKEEVTGSIPVMSTIFMSPRHPVGSADFFVH